MTDKAALLDQIRSTVPEAGEPVVADPKFVRGNDDLQVKVPVGSVKKTAQALRDRLGFDLLNFMTAVDYPKENRLELVYHFMRSSHPSLQLYVKADVSREGTPAVESLAGLFASADWQERETYDLFGVRFEGHPNPRRILLWEGYPGWPLRKDYTHTPDRFDNGIEIGAPK